ncbi:MULTISPECIES: type II toxin-antitoxin system RelE/ParE family toxin [Thalassolituus]|uniref:type II toxin-antitoxin system RelE/ParE family toxin n=3 Tax=Oceanospirillaceae TaxID=135620 RepID=UPI000C548610|nr:addiction module toxin RelE [Oceanospirillaceae bacterium]
MQTIVELPEFQKRASNLFTDEEKLSIINYLARHPMAGDILQGTGGIRKLRWSAQGRGKSGGARVVYFYHNGTMPLFLLTVFGKGEKANLSKAERNDLARLTDLLRKHYGDVDEECIRKYRTRAERSRRVF